MSIEKYNTKRKLFQTLQNFSATDQCFIYNSQFQEFKTVRTLEIQKMTKFGQKKKKILKINNYEKPIKKGESKEGRGFRRLPSFLFPPFL